MADTNQQQPPLSEPHTNGVMDGLTEEEKSKMRPADIDADMREMERRKRVEMMMNSRLFREELERIIETQMKDGAGPSGLLQQISDMMGAQGARFNGNVFKNSNCVLPINDIRGVESMGYAKGEKLLRCKLAAVFRLLDLYGWTQGVGGQITARLNQDQEHFLVNPYGLLYHEITASSLIKVDMQGSIVEQGTTNFGVHVAEFQLHSTIHAARPDIKCIVHITTPSVTAISSLKCGLLPIGQESIVIGDISTHQYIGGSFEPEEKEKIARNLGPINKVMMLTNRGALCCGETVEEAFFNVYNMVLACETQLKLMPAGLDNLNLISEESKKAIFEASRKPPTPQQTTVPIADSAALVEKLEKRWRIGGTEFEALMRMLDNAGFRTGYIYRNPLVKGEPPRPRNDVEVPPAVSSLGYLLEEEELYKQGLWKGGRKGTDRSRWLNSPNVYQKVEILETGTPDPKKITKWVSDGSPTHSSTPVKIDGALQFVPKNTNPKEFKQIQQQIKDYRRADKISAGPQSHILEGVTWEEAKKMQDATISGTGEQVVLVGAASKGIIQRGFQHNAMVYKTPYAKNPFDAVTDQELDQYKKEIERKQKGDIYDESQSESEGLSSFNVSRATHESSTAKSPIQSPVSVTSETEEESRDEPRVLRIETKQVPAPSQPEVVLSDDGGDWSSRYSSQSNSDVENEYDQRNENEEYTIHNRETNDWNVMPRVYRDEPRLEIARSGVVAERMTATLITCPPAVPCKVDSVVVANYKFFENVLDLSLDNTIERKELRELSCNRRRTRESVAAKDNRSLVNVIDYERILPDQSVCLRERRDDKNGRESCLTEPVQAETLKNRVNGLNVSSSSKRKTNALSCSGIKISRKYHLDSIDMSLIYSLTPLVDREYREDVDGETTLKESLSSLTLSSVSPERTVNLNRSSAGFPSDDGKEDFDYEQQTCVSKDGVFKQTYGYTRLDSLCDDNEIYELFEGTCAEAANGNVSSDSEPFEVRSNEGSDLLELPSDAVFELLETSGDTFRNDISFSANEIIAELDANDTYANVSFLLDEIFQMVCDAVCCCTRLANCRCVSLHSPLLSHSVTDHSGVSNSALSSILMDSDGVSSKQWNETAPVFVVHEIVHHVIDVCNESQRKCLNASVEITSRSCNNSKDITNVEVMKETRNTAVANGQANYSEIEREKSDYKQTNRDDLTNEPCQKSGRFPLRVSAESLIETDEATTVKSTETMDTAATIKAAEPAETAAIFEFRTIASNASDAAFQLNFWVEKNHRVDSFIYGNETVASDRSDLENDYSSNGEQSDTCCHSKLSNSIMTLLSESSLSSSASANSSTNRVDTSIFNCSESDETLTELYEESDVTELANDSSIKSTCYAVRSPINHDQHGGFILSPINEESDETSIDSRYCENVHQEACDNVTFEETQLPQNLTYTYLDTDEEKSTNF